MDPSGLEYLDQKFTIYTTDSSEQEIKPNGKNIALSHRNREEYILLAKQTYVSSFLPQFEKMKEGFFSYF